MKPIAWMFAVLLLSAGLGAGCVGRAIREGHGAIAGAKTQIVEIEPLDLSQRIGPVSIGPIENQVGRHGGAWPTVLNNALRARVAREGDFSLAGRRGVNVSGVLIHLEDSVGMKDHALGPDSEVVVRMIARDASSGQTMGMANIVGRARGSLSSSQEDLSEAFAEGVVRWLRRADRGR